MNDVVKLAMVVVMLLALGGEGLAAAAPDHDHHIDVEFADENREAPESDHGKHAVHGCGVCHHMVDGRAHLSSVALISSHHQYERTSDRVSSRALEPPFQPPIEVSA